MPVMARAYLARVLADVREYVHACMRASVGSTHPSVSPVLRASLARLPVLRTLVKPPRTRALSAASCQRQHRV